MSASPVLLSIYCGHSIPWWQNYQQFPLEESYCAMVFRGSTWQQRGKEVDRWFGSGSIVFLKKASYKSDY